MSTTTYDAIIIGGGGNGLCLASYLARSGLKTAIFERRYEEGGGFWTFESVPGYNFNHAHAMEFNDWMPFLYDFELEKLGFQCNYPEAQIGIAFSDGRPPIIIYSVEKEENFAKTHQSISVYSRKDADTYVECSKKALAMHQVFGQLFYNPPPIPSEANPEPSGRIAKQMCQAFGVPEHMAYSTPKDVIDYLFESPEMRTMLYKCVEDWASPLLTAGLGGFSLASLFFIEGNMRIGVGGTHTLAHAMVMAAVREGVEFHEQSAVKKVLIEGDRAAGVQLVDGREFRATKLVASNADLKQTLLEMVGRENLSPTWVSRTENFRYGRSCVLAELCMAVHEAPNYKSAKHDPMINNTFIVMGGVDTPEEMVEHCGEIEAGRIPTDVIPMFLSTQSMHAPGYAPPGKHSIYNCIFFPKASDLSREEWAEVKATFPARALRHFERWAPNMTLDNIVGMRLETPQDFEDEHGMPEGDFCLGAIAPDQLLSNRPFPEGAQYRAEIPGLYLCSSGQHPFGGLSASVGYNAYKVIAEDLGLPYRPWTTDPRGF